MIFVRTRQGLVNLAHVKQISVDTPDSHPFASDDTKSAICFDMDFDDRGISTKRCYINYKTEDIAKSALNKLAEYILANNPLIDPYDPTF